MRRLASFLLVLGALPPVSAGTLPGAAVPQPRVRLHQEPAGTVARAETMPQVPAGGPLMMDKVVVSDSKLPSVPRPLNEEPRTSFSLAKGGPVYRTRLGSTVVELGLWRRTDLLANDAAYKPRTTHAELEVLRVKW